MDRVYIYQRRLKGPVLIVVLLLSALGCASAPRSEYRAGVFLHRDPTYSFRVPNGWRPSTDPDAFAHLREVLRFSTEERKRTLLERQAKNLRQYDIAMVSSNGAGIFVLHTPDRLGRRFPPGFRLTDLEREQVRQVLIKQKWVWSVESITAVEYGPNGAIRARAIVAAAIPFTILIFADQGSYVMMGHYGTPDDEDEGLTGFEEVARSFRFE
jgi:hypothetical protein